VSCGSSAGGHAPAVWCDDRGDGWLGCVEHHHEIAPGLGYAVGSWTPAWNVEQVQGAAPLS
jgi:hypothetical protein